MKNFNIISKALTGLATGCSAGMFYRYRNAEARATGEATQMPQQPDASRSSSPPLTKPKLATYRPSDLLHLHYALQAQLDNGGQVLDGWEMIQNHRAKNGYYGTAYLNEEQKHIIIAHRDTEEYNKPLTYPRVINFEKRYGPYRAWSEFAQKIIAENGPAYGYSFTGHGVGALLAQTSLFLYELNIESVRMDYEKLGFAVAFEGTGSKDVLTALQPSEVNYEINLNTADITVYLSCIPLQAIQEYVGTIYILPNLRPLPHHHTLQDLLQEFSEVGLPKQRQIYIPGTNVVNESADCVLPLRNMNKNVRKFLEELSPRLDRPKIIAQLTEDKTSPELLSLLNSFFISEQYGLVLDRNKTLLEPRVFIDIVAEFLDANPSLYKYSLEGLIKDKLFDDLIKIEQKMAAKNKAPRSKL